MTEFKITEDFPNSEDCSAYSLETFINQNIEKGRTVVSGKLSSYRSILFRGYRQLAINPRYHKDPEYGLYGANVIASLVNRLIQGNPVR